MNHLHRHNETPVEPVEMDLLDGQPAFSFLGTDGEFYIIGHTPREFEIEALDMLKRFNTLGSEAPDTPEFLQLWDRWIWLHMVHVPGQKHIRLQDVQALYFPIDRPHLLKLILERLTATLAATGLMFEGIAATAKVARGSLNAVREA